MKRLLLIVLLSGFISSVVAQSHITYDQIISAPSASQFKGLNISSYTASDGHTYSVGDQLTIGNKSGKIYLYVAMRSKPLFGDRYGDHVTINKISVAGNNKTGAYVVVNLRGIGVTGGMIRPFDMALATGEILSNSQSNPSSQSMQNNVSHINDNTNNTLEKYTAINGEEFIAGETYVIFNPTFEKKYRFIDRSPNQIAGYSAQVIAIYIATEKNQKKVAMKCLIDRNPLPITIKSIEDALSTYEVSVRR